MLSSQSLQNETDLNPVGKITLAACDAGIQKPIVFSL